MNESTLIQLKILVERAVRPVQASYLRRRKMREELLAHVSDVFEEESAKPGDEQAALERTAQRFGPPAELTGQLQAAVPANDAIDRWFCGQPGDTTLRVAARLAAWFLALAVVVYAAATLLAGQATVWPREAILFTGFSILLLPAYMFCLTFATEWIRRAWFEPGRRSGLGAVFLTVGWFAFSLVLFEAGVTWSTGMNAVHRDFWDRIWFTLWLAASVPWLPWILASVGEARARSEREWTALQID